MKKSIVTMLVICVLWAPEIIYAQNAMGRELMRTTPINEISDAYFDEFGHLIGRDLKSEGPTLDYGSWGAYFIPANTGSQASSTLSPREWYIIEKIPSQGLAIGVFLFEEGMPIEHIHDVFGKPQETITLDTEEGYYRTILVYPHHHFFFSRTGHLQTIKERKL